MKQLKYFMYCFFLMQITSLFSMGQGQQRNIEAAFRAAFANFELIHPIPTNLTPESTDFWSYNDGKFDLSPDATTDQDLCTFAAHWLAASIKNKTVARVNNAFNAAAAGTFALLLPGLFLDEDSNIRVYATLAALGLTFINAPEQVAQRVKRRCDRESFSIANAKLFEKKNHAVLLAYFTHLLINDHTPLTYDEKSSLLQKVASDNKAQLTYAVCRNTSPKTISTSLKRENKELSPSKKVEINAEVLKNYEAGIFPLSLNSAKI